MKVALMLSGMVRNIEDTFDSFKYYFMDRYNEIDVFFYGCENINGRIQNIEMMNKMFSPKKIIINESSYYTDRIGCDLLSTNITHKPNRQHWNRSIWALYNVMMVNKLRNEYELETNIEYDMVIRSRVDFFWFRPINEEEINISKNHIITPWDWAFRSGSPWNGPYDYAYSDFYAISNPKMMDFYSKAYEYVNFFSTEKSFHPESLLGYYLIDKPVFEVKKHVIQEYPLISRVGVDSNGWNLPTPYFHPRIWDGDRDFGTNDIGHPNISNLRTRFDK
jgi:hypothetical protein